MRNVTRPVRHGLLASCAMALAVLVLTHDVRSDDKAPSKPSPIEGAWKQLEQKNGDSKDYQKLSDENGVFIKHITGGRFIWTISKDGKVLTACGGKCKIDGDKYSETIEFVQGEGVPETFVGTTFDFTMKVDGDTMNQVGTIQVNGQDFKIDEKYERCK